METVTEAMNNAPRIIIIAGFMGAGKTSVADALARLLRCDMLDLDRLVCEREGRAPHAIIEGDGEQHFRQLETRAFEHALKRAAGEAIFVIALGGGAWTIERNRALAAQHRCFSVWLDAPFELCWHRITTHDRGAMQSRPLARGREQARTLYDARRDCYALASLRVEVAADKSVETLAAEIAAALSS